MSSTKRSSPEQFARALLRDKVSVKTIVSVTGLSTYQVMALKLSMRS